MLKGWGSVTGKAMLPCIPTWIKPLNRLVPVRLTNGQVVIQRRNTQRSHFGIALPVPRRVKGCTGIVILEVAP